MDLEKENKAMPPIKSSASKNSQKTKTKDKSETGSNSNSAKKTKKAPKNEWVTYYAYLNDKKREKLLELPELPIPLKDKKKKRKYVDRRIRVDKIDIVDANKKDAKIEKKNKSEEKNSRSRSRSSSASSETKNKKSSSESSDEEENKNKSKPSKGKRNSMGRFDLKKRSMSAGNEHELKKVSDYKKENSGKQFHFETNGLTNGKIKKVDTKSISRYNKINYNEEEIEELKELNKSYKDSRKEVLSRRAKLDLDKMNIDYDLNYDLINAFNELEVRPVYKNLLRSIRSNL